LIRARAVQVSHSTLLERIESKQATVGIIGLGYVGLPLALTFAEAGVRCIGFDVDAKKPIALRERRSYIGHIAASRIATAIGTGRLDATSDMKRLAEPDALLICVPTPLTESREPDLQYVESTARQIASNMRANQLIVLESTTYPSTTRDVVRPLLETSGLIAGKDFYLAYSPEREDPGNPNWSTARVPKVVGGFDEASGALAAALYRLVVSQVVPVSNCEVAEACKILENVYRSVNIAIVNELKTIFERLGIDVWEVIAAAKTKPFGFQAFYPGPGLGGHCIPIDPFYLSWLARKNDSAARLIELAGEINHAMPHYVIDRVSMALNDDGKPIRGSKIAILGIAYKKNVDDPRESPAFRLLELLGERGAVLTYHDPHVSTLPKMRSFHVPKLQSETLTEEYIARQDCVLIVTDHDSVDYELVGRHASLIVDTRNAMQGLAAKGRIVKA
jgi:UDP-N-acetyl-D-glucosamine dehydrogenase